jgi:hypothetical protein
VVAHSAFVGESELGDQSNRAVVVGADALLADIMIFLSSLAPSSRSIFPVKATRRQR